METDHEPSAQPILPTAARDLHSQADPARHSPATEGDRVCGTPGDPGAPRSRVSKHRDLTDCVTMPVAETLRLQALALDGEFFRRAEHVWACAFGSSLREQLTEVVMTYDEGLRITRRRRAVNKTGGDGDGRPRPDERPREWKRQIL